MIATELFHCKGWNQDEVNKEDEHKFTLFDLLKFQINFFLKNKEIIDIYPQMVPTILGLALSIIRWTETSLLSKCYKQLYTNFHSEI